MKAMSLVLFACVSFSLFGCAEEKAKPTQDKPAASAAPATSAAPAAAPAKAEEKKEGGW